MTARVKGRILLLMLLWLGTVPAWADNETAEITETTTAAVAPTPETAATPAPSELRLKTEPARGDGTNMGTASAQMVLGLGFVLAVIFGLAWVAKRFNLNGAGTGAGMRVVGATTLGPKEKLVLVEVDGKRLLLGVTAHQISLLQTGDAIPTAPVEAGEFAGRIQALLKTGTLHEK